MIKPYYESGGITIYNGNCLEVVPSLGRVDLVVTDPPYGMNLESHRQLFRGVSVAGDKTQDVGQAILDVCSANGWPTISFASPKLPWRGEWAQHLVWDKGPAVGAGGDRETCWKMSWELIQVARMNKLSGGRDEAVLRFHTDPSRMTLHPCQKPIPLIGYLIQKAAGSGAVTLDPFMGSGTTLVACKELGLQAIGVELEERYCEIAVKRLAQDVLFGAT